MKHLVFLFDGTWNSAATGKYEDITNVFRLNLAISRQDEYNNPQVVFYIPGPGNRGAFDRELGGVFGQGIDQIIREAYVSLSSNYEAGDIVYMFGFSRGAIAARALTCLIAEAGLLKPLELHRLDIAWKRFVNINSGIEQHKNLTELSEYVHKNFRIKFVGLFDSVLGRNSRKANIFSELVFFNNAISPIINVAVHFLSIDDNRKAFRPMTWGRKRIGQIVEQIWMPGVHGDIGGVGAPHFIGICSLFSMIAKIKKYTNLKINNTFMEHWEGFLKTCCRIEIKNERHHLAMRLLKHNIRKPDDSDKDQYSHYLFFLIFEKKIIIRDKKIYYSTENLSPFSKLQQSEDIFQPLIAEWTSDALSKI